MRKAFCDRCGKEIEETNKDFVEKMRDFVSYKFARRRDVKPTLFIDEFTIPVYPAELCQDCQDSLKKWFVEGAKI